MKFIITLFICVLICILLVLAFSYYAYRIAFYMPPRPADEDYVLPPGMTEENMGVGIAKCMQQMLKRPCEPVTITGFDGTGLFARYYHTVDDAPVQIQFHGYKSSPFIDMSGGNLLAQKIGHNVLRQGI